MLELPVATHGQTLLDRGAPPYTLLISFLPLRILQKSFCCSLYQNNNEGGGVHPTHNEKHNEKTMATYALACHYLLSSFMTLKAFFMCQGFTVTGQCFSVLSSFESRGFGWPCFVHLYKREKKKKRRGGGERDKDLIKDNLVLACQATKDKLNASLPPSLPPLLS